MNKLEKINLDSSRLQTIAQEILKEAARLGADQAEVSIEGHHGFSVSAHGGDVETVEYNQDKAVDITVYFGKRTGSAGISDLQPQAIRAAVEAACHIAKFTDEDPAAGIADKEDLALHYPQVDLNFPWSISVEKAIELACAGEREALAYDKRIMSAEEARVVTGEAIRVYANSHGFAGFYLGTHHEICCVLVAKDGDEMQRDYSYTVATDPQDLTPISQVAREAGERTVRRLGARRIKTTKAPVIFVPEEARGLIGHFAAAIQGSQLYRKSSFLLDHLDKKIFPDFIYIDEQPHISKALGSAPFDEDGVLTRSNIFIQDGILCNYALDIYTARKLGMKTTGDGGGMHNLTIRPGNKDLMSLLKTMDKGLLITEMMGHGINMVTGDYSRGAGGYWVENGEIQYPVHEVTVAGNLRDIYQRIVAVGNDVDRRGNILTGSILIEEMMIAGD